MLISDDFKDRNFLGAIPISVSIQLWVWYLSRKRSMSLDQCLQLQKEIMVTIILAILSHAQQNDDFQIFSKSFKIWP